jgi:hypothetical protein
MARRWVFRIELAPALLLGFCAVNAASAQGVTLKPIPPADCQKFAAQAQAAAGFALKAGEDDFTDLTDDSDGRSCHISGSASGQTYGAPIDLITKLAGVFADWRDDPQRAADGPGGAEKGLVSGNRIAEIEVSWEPGPGATCSDKEPLSACKISPQQKLWTAIIDIVEKPGK